jgi:LysR family transcriptional regulator, glycine cleavage system transcriptional activator
MAAPFQQAVQAELVRPQLDGRPGSAGPLACARRSIPSIAGLLAFEATARHRSFSRAARDLNLSQGAVSKRVRQLEEVVGIALFGRDRQTVSLTAAGAAYLEEIRWVLAGLEAATEQLTRTAAGVSGIAVAAPTDFARYWLVPPCPPFRHVTRRSW